MSARILVIEDEIAFRHHIEKILTDAGYHVNSAADGLGGMQLFSSLHPDLVITDIFMPEKEGIEVIIDIRKISEQAKIIAISGGGKDKAYLPMARRLGADDAFVKPFKANDLISAVQKLLAARTTDA